MPLFWQTRQGSLKAGECFFLPNVYIYHARSLFSHLFIQRLGEGSFTKIVEQVVVKTGLDTGTKKVCNQSLRPSTMNIEVWRFIPSVLLTE